MDLVENIGEKRLQRWFQKGTGSQNNKIRVKQELKQIISFKQLNLIKEWPIQGNFDFIFCRNVLIYFDKDTKEKLANRYASVLNAGGTLFIGHSESLHQLDTPFHLIGKTIYQKAL